MDGSTVGRVIGGPGRVLHGPARAADNGGMLESVLLFTAPWVVLVLVLLACGWDRRG